MAQYHRLAAVLAKVLLPRTTSYMAHDATLDDSTSVVQPVHDGSRWVSALHALSDNRVDPLSHSGPDSVLCRASCGTGLESRIELRVVTLHDDDTDTQVTSLELAWDGAESAVRLATFEGSPTDLR